jgi:hypothetical protein
MAPGITRTYSGAIIRSSTSNGKVAANGRRKPDRRLFGWEYDQGSAVLALLGLNRPLSYNAVNNMFLWQASGCLDCDAATITDLGAGGSDSGATAGWGRASGMGERSIYRDP